MGRTKRRRLVKKKQTNLRCFSADLNIIELNRWLKTNLWLNETKLKIASFPLTGRGVMTTKFIDCGDIIIEIPYELMITYTVLENSENFKTFVLPSKEKFTIHELLSLYILLEQHLENYSSWKCYLKSLPTMNELCLLWLCSEQELGYITEELLIMIKEERDKLDESWVRVRSLLDTDYTCWHCAARAEHLLTRDLYTWAYILVHTRAVYLDPYKVLEVSTDYLSDVLLDQPSMGLCPFLDMFNHTSNTNTQAFLSNVNGILNYFLVTGSKFNKFEQVFISYGYHDNQRLVTQYGFVLPTNRNDTIHFTLKHILKTLKLFVCTKQYKFICDKNLNKDIYVNYNGCSFNMAAVLYILTNKQELDWSMKIYSSDYETRQLSDIYTLTRDLLEVKLDEYTEELIQIKNKNELFSRHFDLYLKYLESRIEFVSEVLNKIIPKFIL